MTDGNTAIQVSPTEDSEMAGIKQVFDKALNAIVDMSRLAKEVEQLRASVSTMQAQVDHLRRQNEWLDEMLAKVRTERDTLNHQLGEANQTIATLKRDNDQVNAWNVSLTTENDSLRQQKHDAEQARDNAEMKVMELEDTIKSLNLKLDKFHSIAKELFPEQQVVAPTPVPVEVAPAEHDIPGMAYNKHDVEVAQSPVNPEAPPTRTYIGHEWQANAHWDGEKGEYYTES